MSSEEHKGILKSPGSPQKKKQVSFSLEVKQKKASPLEAKRDTDPFEIHAKKLIDGLVMIYKEGIDSKGTANRGLQEKLKKEKEQEIASLLSIVNGLAMEDCKGLIEALGKISKSGYLIGKPTIAFAFSTLLNAIRNRLNKFPETITTRIIDEAANIYKRLTPEADIENILSDAEAHITKRITPMNLKDLKQIQSAIEKLYLSVLRAKDERFNVRLMAYVSLNRVVNRRIEDLNNQQKARNEVHVESFRQH